MRHRASLLEARRPDWNRLEALVTQAESLRGPARLGPEQLSELATQYRALASDLMRVRRDRLGPDLERHLDGLAARAHNTLYSGSSRRLSGRSIGGLILDFPGALRRNWVLFLVACLVFYGPAGLAGWAAHESESYALTLLSPGHLEAVEEMYSSAPNGRESGTNAAMTGYYVWNNVGIALRCFATGILLGLGSLWFLVSNGLFLGTVLGHLIRVDLGSNILSFVSTHGPWELTAIVISGAAGFQMGLSFVLTRGRTRLGSLQSIAPELLRQVAGAGVFLGLAAILEGWVSPSSLPAETKYSLGIAGWVIVSLYLTMGGRGRALPADVQKRRGGT